MPSGMVRCATAGSWREALEVARGRHQDAAHAALVAERHGAGVAGPAPGAPLGDLGTVRSATNLFIGIAGQLGAFGEAHHATDAHHALRHSASARRLGVSATAPSGAAASEPPLDQRPRHASHSPHRR